MAFKHKLKAQVRLVDSGEVGTVIGRAESIDGKPQYSIRYMAADGRQVESWWADSAIEAV